MCFVDSHPSVVAAASTTTTRSVMCVCQARRGLLRSERAREPAGCCLTAAFPSSLRSLRRATQKSEFSHRLFLAPQATRSACSAARNKKQKKVIRLLRTGLIRTSLGQQRPSTKPFSRSSPCTTPPAARHSSAGC